jgi:3-hydroxybutyryl-CoA dehydrogenase
LLIKITSYTIIQTNYRMKNITVIGSGTMGNGIAHTFAQNGYSVSLVDINDAALQKGLQTIAGNLDRQIKKELLTKLQKQPPLTI